MEVIWFWMARPIAEFFGAILLLIMIGILVYLPALIREWRCKHTEYFEDHKCHAICRNCRKDLGFIENVRKQNDTDQTLSSK
jgi:hypothetical protein